MASSRHDLSADDWMTTTQVALELRVSDTRVRYLANLGRLSVRLTPLGRLYDRASVEAYAASREARR